MRRRRVRCSAAVSAWWSLKRFKDAIADGDTIHAVIRGSAVNNDGAMKAGYLAPSVDGQAAAVSEAIAMSGVPADSITYM